MFPCCSGMTEVVFQTLKSQECCPCLSICDRDFEWTTLFDVELAAQALGSAFELSPWGMGGGGEESRKLNNFWRRTTVCEFRCRQAKTTAWLTGNNSKEYVSGCCILSAMPRASKREQSRRFAFAFLFFVFAARASTQPSFVAVVGALYVHV